MDFVHLHVHTEYSLADANNKIGPLVKKAKELGMKAIATTDHGNIFSLPIFYKTCKDEGMKPILGMEAYVAPNQNISKIANVDNANYHLVLLCENNQGYQNLIQISSDASLNGFYYRPRTDKQMLRKYHEGLICLSACLGGEIQKLLVADKYEDAKTVALEYNEIFGQGNFFLELQDHGIKEQLKINPMLVKLGRDTGIPLICTNDCHYIDRTGFKSHDVLMAIQAGKTIYDEKRKKYPCDEFYVKSPAEMYKLFGYVPEAIANTVKIADRCNVELEFGKNKLPAFDLPPWFNGTNYDFLKKLCYEGAERVYGEVSQEIIDRTEYEINVINNMGYNEYFLIVWDFFRFCLEGTMNYGEGIKDGWEEILTGPGRGSGAGSIVLFELGITKIDPLRYDLLFERFLDPSRISMPDIDSDFEYERRQEVIDYTILKYGRENVSQIITFSTMAPRACIRQVGKALDYPYSLYDAMAKMIPKEVGITLTKAIELNKDLENWYKTDDRVKELLDVAIELEGLPIYTGTHAAGVLITDRKGVTAHVPVWDNDGAIVAGYTMGILEEMGLLKMDFLGLRTLTVIKDAKEAIFKNHGIEINLDEIYQGDDKAPLKLIQDGFTHGIFQLEGNGMTGFMKELKPTSWEDVTLGISVYRPGPMQYIPQLLENRRNPENIQYRFESLRPILSGTYGILAYQEQIMRMVIAVAGYSKSDSDGFRRIISKKKRDMLPLHQRWFVNGRGTEDDDGHGHIKKYSPIPGGVALGNNVADLQLTFQEMMDFASYCFNKSHAAAYMVVGKVTAWMLYYYPTEFMAALMTSVKGDFKKISRYIKACMELGIEMLPPDINTGSENFVALPGKKIVFTLSAKSTNADALQGIIEIRKDTHFDNFTDFLVKNASTINKPTVEALTAIGALDSLGIVRSQVLAGLDDIFDSNLRKAKDKVKRNLASWGKYTNYINSKCFDCDSKKLTKTLCSDCDTIRTPRAKKPAQEIVLELDLTDAIPNISEYPKDIILNLEKKFLGIYLSGHPLHKYSFAIKNMGDFKSSYMDYDIDEATGNIMINSPIRDGQKIKFIAILNNIRETITREKKQQMAFVEFEDLYGTCNAVIFPGLYDKIKSRLKEDEIFAVCGAIQLNDGEPPSIICEDMKLAKEQVIDRVVVTFNSLEESANFMKEYDNNPNLRGFNPTYVNYGNIKVLLSNNYWLNVQEIHGALKDYKYEILNW